MPLLAQGSLSVLLTLLPQMNHATIDDLMRHLLLPYYGFETTSEDTRSRMASFELNNIDGTKIMLQV